MLQDIDRYKTAIDSYNVDSLIDIIIASHSNIEYDNKTISNLCISEHTATTITLPMQAKQNSRKTSNPPRIPNSIQDNTWMLDTGRIP